MVRKIIEYYDELLDFVSTPYGLVKLVEKDGSKRPARQIGFGEYEDINFFDKGVHTSYWRLNGEVVQQQVEDAVNVCDPIVERQYGLKYVFVGKVDCTGEEEFFNQFVSKVQKSNKKVAGLRGRISSQVNSFNIDRDQIAGQEYTKDFQYRFEYLVISIDVTINYKVKLNCLVDDCV